MSDLSSITSGQNEHQHQQQQQARAFESYAMRAQCGVPPDFACPDDMVPHLAKIFAGEYDVPDLAFVEPPRIIDVGANCGAFSAWAFERWPGASVRCYEPNPEAFAYLTKNVETDDPSALQQRAVGDVPKGCVASRFLKFGRNNLGEASFNDLGEQRAEGVSVEVASAADMPDCEILKLDTEGEEIPILRNYIESRMTRLPIAILLEFHSERDRRIIDQKLVGIGYSLRRARIDQPERGVLAYVRAIGHEVNGSRVA